MGVAARTVKVIVKTPVTTAGGAGTALGGLQELLRAPPRRPTFCGTQVEREE